MNPDKFRFITLQQLDALVCLVEERGFSKAARKMLLTQPSLSKHIKNLEDFTSCRLINRAKSGISLTTEGSILYGYAKRILQAQGRSSRQTIILAKDTASGLIFTSARHHTCYIPAPESPHHAKKNIPGNQGPFISRRQ